MQNPSLSNPPPRGETSSSRTLWALIAVWLVGVIAGFLSMNASASRSGDDGAAPVRWPQASALSRSDKLPTLLIFAHPKCPCTAATVGELARIVARVKGRVCATVVFVQPKGMVDEWSRTSLWDAAGKVPGVTRMIDREGREASRFHATTAGRSLLYDAAGQLVFQGGITASRGHAGDNAGETAILDLLIARTPATACTAAFGCPLFAEDPRR